MNKVDPVMVSPEANSFQASSLAYAVFGFLTHHDTLGGYPADKFVHLAGMVRHVAINAMKQSPPEGVPKDWVEAYVAGHAKAAGAQHRQFSYLPLCALDVAPSVADRASWPTGDDILQRPAVTQQATVRRKATVRRIMLAIDSHAQHWLEHLASHLAGMKLCPTKQTQLDQSFTLLRLSSTEGIWSRYTKPSNVWSSVTPVILPGHGSNKPAKTRKLIESALRQSGVEPACEYAWHTMPRFPVSLPAQPVERGGQSLGYIRPGYLQTKTAVHLTLTFAQAISGPLAIGAGRHCGFGVMAQPEDETSPA